ncbi:MAG: PHP domain-containing protein [Actinomycetia bacterium]|nr:PHP domain-containing protein [Actinomycetes bacterium]
MGDGVTDPATQAAAAALRKAVYYLDRGLAPGQKVRAFRNAADIVAGLAPGELQHRVESGTLTELAGIGKSTGSVIADGVTGGPSAYLARLEEESACEPTVGTELRNALKADLHCHTAWSDGGASVREMAETAADLGHEYMAITDHSQRLTVAHGLSVERLRDQLGEIDRLRADLAPFRILTGMEVDILVDGTLDLPEVVLGELDIVVASVHSKLRMAEPEMTQRMVRAIASPHVDILGHCTGRKVLGTGRPPSAFDAEIVFAACSRFDTAVEINCRPERRDPPDELIALALEWDCLFSIDTDAHAPGQLEWQAWGCDKATEMGIPAESVVNTWDADALLEWSAAFAA